RHRGRVASLDWCRPRHRPGGAAPRRRVFEARVHASTIEFFCRPGRAKRQPGPSLLFSHSHKRLAANGFRLSLRSAGMTGSKYPKIALRIAAPVPAYVAAHAPRLDLAELAEYAPDEATQLVVEPYRQADRLGALEARERKR